MTKEYIIRDLKTLHTQSNEMIKLENAYSDATKALNEQSDKISQTKRDLAEHMKGHAELLVQISPDQVLKVERINDIEVTITKLNIDIQDIK